jgi:hypothetical protein
VTDRFGTQLAAAHDEDVTSQSIGENFAHRTYFHGGPVELPRFPRPQENARHITATHLSNVFRSNTTKKWKVAIASPIFADASPEMPGASGKEFLGIFVVTINLGDFEFFRSSNSHQRDRFAVLVDGRDGDDTGKILQHPLFDDLRRAEFSLGEVIEQPQYRVPTELLKGKGGIYEDPLGNYPGYGSEAHRAKQAALARFFAKRWIAAAVPVRSPSLDSTVHSGLMVLVQSDYDGVVGPARELGNQFIRNSLWMLAVVIAVSLALWYIVVRMFREPRAGLRRKVSPAADSTPLHGMSTLAAPTRKRD